MDEFEFLGEALCLDFLNTLHDTAASNPGEDLASDADVANWAVEAGILSAGEAARLPARRLAQVRLPGGARRASLLDQARTLRETLRQMFRRAMRDGKIAARDLETLNLWLRQFPVAGRIEKSNGDLRMTWESQARSADKIFYAIVKSAAELVASGRWRTVRECASDTCTWMFLDTSKNHSRRWCEMSRCGNRDKVHRFRVRSRRALLRKTRH